MSFFNPNIQLNVVVILLETLKHTARYMVDLFTWEISKKKKRCIHLPNGWLFSFPLWLQELYPVLWLQELLKSLFLWQNVIPNGRISRNHSTKMFFRAKLGHYSKGLGIFTCPNSTSPVITAISLDKKTKGVLTLLRWQRIRRISKC